MYIIRHRRISLRRKAPHRKGGGVLRFSDEFLTELRSRVDIEELVGRYTEIKHRGSRTPVALCPFHT